MTIELIEIQQQMMSAKQNMEAALEDVRETTATRTRAETDHQKKYDAALLSSEQKSKELREAEARQATQDTAEFLAYAKGDQQVAKSALHAWETVLQGLQSLAWAHRQELKMEMAS